MRLLWTLDIHILNLRSIFLATPLCQCGWAWCLSNASTPWHQWACTIYKNLVVSVWGVVVVLSCWISESCMVKKVGIVMEMVELKLLWVDGESFFFAILPSFSVSAIPLLGIHHCTYDTFLTPPPCPHPPAAAHQLVWCVVTVLWFVMHAHQPHPAWQWHSILIILGQLNDLHPFLVVEQGGQHSFSAIGWSISIQFSVQSGRSSSCQTEVNRLRSWEGDTVVCCWWTDRVVVQHLSTDRSPFADPSQSPTPDRLLGSLIFLPAPHPSRTPAKIWETKTCFPPIVLREGLCKSCTRILIQFCRENFTNNSE